MIERKFCYGRHAGWNSDTCQTTAELERMLPDDRHGRRKRDTCQIAASRERPTTYVGHARGNRHGRQPAAITERMVPNARHAGRNSETCQTATTIERRASNACDRQACHDAWNHNYTTTALVSSDRHLSAGDGVVEVSNRRSWDHWCRWACVGSSSRTVDRRHPEHIAGANAKARDGCRSRCRCRMAERTPVRSAIAAVLDAVVGDRRSTS